MDIESTYTYLKGSIESIADVIDIVNRPYEYFPEILDERGNDSYAPIGRNQQGHPRPYPHGIWFRGQADYSWTPIPSVFRNRVTSEYSDKKKDRLFFDERDMFTDLRSRVSNADLRGYDNVELMGIMQHHHLPTRLMDWTESPLVACHFAAFSQYFDYKDLSSIPKNRHHDDMIVDRDCTLYVMNAYRLNSSTNLALHPESAIFQQSDFDVYIRAIMAEHTHLASILERAVPTAKVAANVSTREVRAHFDEFREIISPDKRLESHDEEESLARLMNERPELRSFYKRMLAPIALIPRRSHPRMDVQLACFTLHGGKYIYSTRFSEGGDHSNRDRMRKMPKDRWAFIGEPIHLSDINTPDGYLTSGIGYNDVPSYRQFMKKFKISKHAVNRIMIELDRLGITESMIFPDMENQASFSKRRWTTRGYERQIFSLPPLMKTDKTRSSPKILRNWENKIGKDYMSIIYGKKPDKAPPSK